MRIVYIAGRFTHLLPGGEHDAYAEAEEFAEETYWAAIVGKVGYVWIAPIANSIRLERAFEPQQFIDRDLEIIGRLRPGYDVLLLRPGWDVEPESKGTRQEHDLASELGIEVLYGLHGVDAVLARLAELDAMPEAEEMADES